MVYEICYIKKNEMYYYYLLIITTNITSDFTL